MNTCAAYIPWRLKSDLLKVDECYLFDHLKKQCHKNEDCPRPWVKK